MQSAVDAADAGLLLRGLVPWAQPQLPGAQPLAARPGHLSQHLPAVQAPTARSGPAAHLRSSSCMPGFFGPRSLRQAGGSGSLSIQLLLPGAGPFAPRDGHGAAQRPAGCSRQTNTQPGAAQAKPGRAQLPTHFAILRQQRESARLTPLGSLLILNTAWRVSLGCLQLRSALLPGRCGCLRVLAASWCALRVFLFAGMEAGGRRLLHMHKRPHGAGTVRTESALVEPASRSVAAPVLGSRAVACWCCGSARQAPRWPRPPLP